MKHAASFETWRMMIFVSVSAHPLRKLETIKVRELINFHFVVVVVGVAVVFFFHTTFHSFLANVF